MKMLRSYMECSANELVPPSILITVRYSMNLPRQNFARINTLTSLYTDASQCGCTEYMTLAERIAEIGDIDYHPELYELGRRRDIAGVQTIVFAAMAFESAIYDYSADHLGDAYVLDHLDKLDILSKWIVALRLVAGYDLRKDMAPYAALKNLISARNKLVHSKSEPLNFDRMHAQIAEAARKRRQHDMAVKNAYKAIVLMSLELDARLGPASNPLPSFNKHINVMLDIPEKLKGLVDDCKQTSRRSGNT